MSNVCNNIDLQKSIDNLVENVKGCSLSNHDLLRIQPNVKITMSTDLPKLRFSDQSLNHQGIGILLWQWSENAGHWLGLIKNNNTVEIYDSYAFPFDKINEKLNSSMKISPNVLLNLIKKSGYKPIFNKTRNQEIKLDDSTCGRWVLLRLLFKKYNIKEFNKILKDFKKDNCLDALELATIYTYNKILK